MAKREHSKAAQIRELAIAHPSWTSERIADLLGDVTVAYVSSQRWKLKKLAVAEKAASEPKIYKSAKELFESTLDDEQMRKILAPSQKQPTPDATTAILEERGKRYGAFTGHAEVTQGLKTLIYHGLQKRQQVLAADQIEALDMICHKIGRIVNGDPDYADSWVDIAGYARLVADRLEGKVR